MAHRLQCQHPREEPPPTGDCRLTILIHEIDEATLDELVEDFAGSLAARGFGDPDGVSILIIQARDFPEPDVLLDSDGEFGDAAQMIIPRMSA